MPSPVLIAFAGTFTLYTGPAAPDPRIKAITQRGAIYELIINCDPGSAIATYSPAEWLYCTPALRCDRDRRRVVSASCRGG